MTCVMARWSVCISVLLTGLAQAEEGTRILTLSESTTQRAPSTPYAKGTWTAQVYGSYIHDVDQGNADLSGGTVGVGYYIYNGGFEEGRGNPGVNGVQGYLGVMFTF